MTKAATETGTTGDLRTKAVALFGCAVKAADPADAVARALQADPLEPGQGRLVLVALGKAAPAMMKEALHHLPSPMRAIVVTNTENAQTIPGARVLLGGHPFPDAGSAKAGAALLQAVSGLDPMDQVLALISGGGSALAIAPVAGISLAEKQQVNKLLLESGLDITQMNLLRQCLSRIKGGGLLAAAGPARVRALILSDVIGDDLRIVASGPTTSPVGTSAEARALLHRADLWQHMPPAVHQHLQQDHRVVRGAKARNQIIGSNRASLDAMAAACPDAEIVDDRLMGDVAAAATKILQAIEARAGARTLIFGGETTVKLTGDGLGGRNQELALRVALGAAHLDGDWVFLSGGTDGRDGPTDAAGGLVDGGTIQRMRAAGLDPQAILNRNDSYHGLQAAGDLLTTGGTGTNVADVQLFLRGS